MKIRITVLFVGLCLIGLILSLLSITYLHAKLDTGKEGLQRVNRNDILKNAERFLDSGEDELLSKSLRDNKSELLLYELDGTLLYDSSDKRNDNNSRKVDINRLMEEADESGRIYILNAAKSQENTAVVAILQPQVMQPDLEEQKRAVAKAIWIHYGSFSLLLAVVLVIIYHYVIRPFYRLEQFASEIAKGNLEIPMEYPRQNIFGAFTWAFDMLRKELRTAREKQMEAEKAKKELVAVLSHDIRTPVASIKAYAECLSELPDKNTERSDHYINVIIIKADELAKLSQDMFLHAVSDLEKLEVTPKVYQSRELLNNILEPMILQYANRIVITSAIPEVSIYTDPARLAQVFENIFTNAYKYAPGSKILVKAELNEDMLTLSFRDFGSGAAPEDLPFLFDKFYRGKNAKESVQEGSGLGLYICSYILEKMGGRIKAYNYYASGIEGFVVEVTLKII